MRIAQISDFHFTHITWNPFRLFSKRLFGNLYWLFNRKKIFFPEQLAPLPKLFTELQVDWVLLGGDFTTTSLKEEFKKAVQFVSKISQPWIAIPGNHDHYTRRSHRQKHYYRYLSNRPARFFSLEKQGVEAHLISPNWWIVALDTAHPTPPHSSEGLFSEALEKNLETLLKLIPSQDAILLFNHYPFFQNDASHRNLRRGEELQKLLQRHPRIRIYAHGHTHRHTIADLQANQLPLILDSGCPAQGQGTWNLIDFASQGCTVTSYQWDNQWKPFRTEEISWKR